MKKLIICLFAISMFAACQKEDTKITVKYTDAFVNAAAIVHQGHLDGTTTKFQSGVQKIKDKLKEAIEAKSESIKVGVHGSEIIDIDF